MKSLGINDSRVAEEALAAELERRRRAQVLAEVEADVRATQDYARRHGDHGDLVQVDGEDYVVIVEKLTTVPLRLRLLPRRIANLSAFRVPPLGALDLLFHGV